MSDQKSRIPTLLDRARALRDGAAAAREIGNIDGATSMEASARFCEEQHERLSTGLAQPGEIYVPEGPTH